VAAATGTGGTGPAVPGLAATGRAVSDAVDLQEAATSADNGLLRFGSFFRFSAFTEPSQRGSEFRPVRKVGPHLIGTSTRRCRASRQRAAFSRMFAWLFSRVDANHPHPPAAIVWRAHPLQNVAFGSALPRMHSRSFPPYPGSIIKSTSLLREVANSPPTS
jgi:hypothetical protein